MATEDSGTGKLLVGLTAVAGFVALLGIGVVWAFSYGPLA